MSDREPQAGDDFKGLKPFDETIQEDRAVEGAEYIMHHLPEVEPPPVDEFLRKLNQKIDEEKKTEKDGRAEGDNLSGNN